MEEFLHLPCRARECFWSDAFLVDSKEYLTDLITVSCSLRERDTVRKFDLIMIDFNQ